MHVRTRTRGTVFNYALFVGLAMLLQGGGLQLPAPVGLVNDFAHVIPAQTAQALTVLAQAVRSASPGEIAIVTLPDLKGQPVERVSLDIGRQWKVGNIGQPGDPNRNAGVVVLVVPKQTNSSGRGECRIEVGRGAEGYITDSDAGEMCRAAVAQYFRQGDYGGGIAFLTAGVARAMAGEYHFSLDSAVKALGGGPVDYGRSRGGSRGGGGIPPMVWIVLLIVLLGMLRGGGGGRRGGCLPWVFFLPWGGGGGGRGGWGGGGFGGGFGGGGGGGFGGFGGGGGFSGGGGGSSW